MNWNQLEEAWRCTPDVNSIDLGASERAIRGAERALGFSLPSELRELYRISDGPSICAGNVIFNPLQTKTVTLPEPFVNPFKPNDPPMTDVTRTGIVQQTRSLREYGWPIPPEVLVIGGNGSDELYLIWLPEVVSERFDHPVVMIGEITDSPKSMTVVATRLMRFLCTETVRYLLAFRPDGSDAALDALEVPTHLRDAVPDGALSVGVRKWADPELPDFDPDPYEQKYDANALKSLFR